MGGGKYNREGRCKGKELPVQVSEAGTESPKLPRGTYLPALISLRVFELELGSTRPGQIFGRKKRWVAVVLMEQVRSVMTTSKVSPSICLDLYSRNTITLESPSVRLNQSMFRQSAISESTYK